MNLYQTNIFQIKFQSFNCFQSTKEAIFEKFFHFLTNYHNTPCEVAQNVIKISNEKTVNVNEAEEIASENPSKKRK